MKTARRRSLIWALELHGLDEHGAREALRFVELGDRGFPFRPVAGHVGALLGLPLLRLGAELVQPRLGSVELRAELFDEGADLFDDGLDSLAQAL